jgi:hypothetical protein
LTTPTVPDITTLSEAISASFLVTSLAFIPLLLKQRETERERERERQRERETESENERLEE